MRQWSSNAPHQVWQQVQAARRKVYGRHTQRQRCRVLCCASRTTYSPACDHGSGGSTSRRCRRRALPAAAAERVRGHHTLRLPAGCPPAVGAAAVLHRAPLDEGAAAWQRAAAATPLAHGQQRRTDPGQGAPRGAECWDGRWLLLGCSVWHRANGCRRVSRRGGRRCRAAGGLCWRRGSRKRDVWRVLSAGRGCSSCVRCCVDATGCALSGRWWCAGRQRSTVRAGRCGAAASGCLLVCWRCSRCRLLLLVRRGQLVTLLPLLLLWLLLHRERRRRAA